MLNLVQVLPDSARDLGITDARCFDVGRGEAKRLFREYFEELGEDLNFQGVAEELADVPGKYGPPGGTLLLGWSGEEAVGCGGLCPLGDGVAEIKRLYVTPSARGSGAARQILNALLESARVLRYRRVVLDTLERLEPANALYRSAGFREIEAYYENPIPGVVYFGMDIEPAFRR